MNAAQLIVARFSELIETGKLELAFNYLSEDVIYNSWMGVVEGRGNVVNFLQDAIRFSHHPRSYERWRAVQHSLEPSLWEAGPHRRPVFDECGYDGDGIATFERNGTISTRPRFAFERIQIKETIVVKNNLITLINISKRL